MDWIGWFKFIRHPTKGADTATAARASADAATAHRASADTATAQYGPRMKGGANGSAFDVQMCEMG